MNIECHNNCLIINENFGELSVFKKADIYYLAFFIPSLFIFMILQLMSEIKRGERERE